MRGIWILVAIMTIAAGSGAATENSITASTVLHRVTADGSGENVGTVSFQDTEYGLIIKPELHGLTGGLHAAHVHENPSCAPDHGESPSPAGAAGDHYDPYDSDNHRGPYGDGHLGDLPNLVVEDDGTTGIPVLAPRVTVADVKGHALIIHAGADHYHEHANHSQGKGGARVYCGVIR